MELKYILDPLIVDKTFGTWILSRKFVDPSQLHLQLSQDRKVLLMLKCIKDDEFIFTIDVKRDVIEHIADIIRQLYDQMTFSKAEMLETAAVFLPTMRRFIFCVSNHPNLHHLFTTQKPQVKLVFL